MKSYFTSILIIYNPVSSSGKAEIRARRLSKQLERREITNVKVVASKYPGHSEELAFDESLRAKKPLIISVSGDGGYNEVINGSLRAQSLHKDVKPVCAILAAGNANDHRKAVAKKPLLRAILNGKVESMDVLKLNFGNTERYAHSYIGIGVTAEIATELQNTKLTRWKEIKIVTRNLLKFDHFGITSNGKKQQIDSMVFANIHRMAKVLKLNDKTNLRDGLFTVFIIPHRTRFKFIYLVCKLTIFGVKNTPQLNDYSFTLNKPRLGQLDGEVIALPVRTDIRISVGPGMLSTLR